MKTNPIGVRFRPDVLEKLDREHGIKSPQAALVFLERFYCQHWQLTKDIAAPLRTEKPLIIKKPPQKATNKAKEPDSDTPVEIVQPTPEVFNGSKMPSNLEELKAMCPKNITGVDRTIWIAEERKKYGI